MEAVQRLKEDVNDILTICQKHSAFVEANAWDDWVFSTLHEADNDMTGHVVKGISAIDMESYYSTAYTFLNYPRAQLQQEADAVVSEINSLI